jgi:hypothetical protein
MKSLLRPLGLSVALLASAWFLLPSSNQPSDGNEAPATAARINASVRSSNIPSTTTSTWSHSPFGIGAPVAEQVTALPPRALARQKKMTERGYGTPPAYFAMGLGELQALAEKGDADAMLQLAEQYLEESRLIVSDPNYPTNGDIIALGKGYLAAAVDAGSSRAASLMSQRYFGENNMVDAYAWKLMTERFGSGHVPDIDANQFTYMSEEQKKAAYSKYLAMAETTSKARSREAARRRGSAGL